MENPLGCPKNMVNFKTLYGYLVEINNIIGFLHETKKWIS